MKKYFAVLLGVVFTALLLTIVPTQTVEGQERSEKILKSERKIPNQYIVVFEDWAAGELGSRSNAPAVVEEFRIVYGGKINRVFQHAVNGYSAELNETQVEALSRDPRVKYIEEDGMMYANATQTNATWGLDRIDQRDLPLNGTYTYNADGTGVRAYIIDTGIRASHNEFGSRVTGGYTAINDGRGTDDCNGHGTHVAGTTGGSVYGVAKNVTLVPVRVLDCRGSGTTSGVIAGVDWVTANNNGAAAVANMSLGGGASSTLDTAVSNSINAGITYAVAAGNDNLNACNYSPARVASAITVGATTNTDARASYSNFGSCLDVFAPGSSITSAWHTGDTATNTISGTSMASPHVAGVAALILQGNPTASPSSVTTTITSNATTNKVTSAGTGSPNLLLYMAFISGGGGGTNTPPTASFTFSCSGLTCSFNGSGSSDPDGSISSYTWNFGDGTTGTGATTSRTYASGGTYTVTLTVTDNGGATGSTSQSVTATAPGSNITLSVTMTKAKGINYANLSWSGTSGSTDVKEDGTKIATVSGTTYQNNLGRGSGTRTYQVCNAGTTTCSNQVTVTY
ncbi:MAG: S8 family serine peptidase [Acidobacteriota bacterium]|jgi:PKD repeat protein|nr:S8 family serine peptidase [Acidobacteriota bacterium]